MVTEMFIGNNIELEKADQQSMKSFFQKIGYQLYLSTALRKNIGMIYENMKEKVKQEYEQNGDIKLGIEQFGINYNEYCGSYSLLVDEYTDCFEKHYIDVIGKPLWKKK